MRHRKYVGISARLARILWRADTGGAGALAARGHMIPGGRMKPAFFRVVHCGQVQRRPSLCRYRRQQPCRSSGPSRKPCLIRRPAGRWFRRDITLPPTVGHVGYVNFSTVRIRANVRRDLTMSDYILNRTPDRALPLRWLGRQAHSGRSTAARGPRLGGNLHLD